MWKKYLLLSPLGSDCPTNILGVLDADFYGVMQLEWDGNSMGYMVHTTLWPSLTDSPSIVPGIYWFIEIKGYANVQLLLRSSNCFFSSWHFLLLSFSFLLGSFLCVFCPFFLSLSFSCQLKALFQYSGQTTKETNGTEVRLSAYLPTVR